MSGKNPFIWGHFSAFALYSFNQNCFQDTLDPHVGTSNRLPQQKPPRFILHLPESLIRDFILTPLIWIGNRIEITGNTTNTTTATIIKVGFNTPWWAGTFTRTDNTGRILKKYTEILQQPLLVAVKQTDERRLTTECLLFLTWFPIVRTPKWLLLLSYLVFCHYLY